MTCWDGTGDRAEEHADVTGAREPTAGQSHRRGRGIDRRQPHAERSEHRAEHTNRASELECISERARAACLERRNILLMLVGAAGISPRIRVRAVAGLEIRERHPRHQRSSSAASPERASNGSRRC